MAMLFGASMDHRRSLLRAGCVAAAMAAFGCSLCFAQSDFRDGVLDPTRRLAESAAGADSSASAKAARAPLPEEYVWTAGDVTALRADRSKFSWASQQLRSAPHFFCARFAVRRVPREATVYIAGPRSAKVYLNGRLAGEFASDIDQPIGFHVFRADAGGLLRAGENVIAVALSSGARVWICDAERQADLERLAGETLGLPASVMWAGSAGLALASALPATGGIVRDVAAGRHRSLGATLVFAGTPHRATEMQLERLCAEGGAVALAAGSGFADMRKHGCGLVRIDVAAVSGKDIREVWRRASEQEPVVSLALTGGDTAALVLRALGALGARSIEMRGDAAVEIPWGVVRGGLADGSTVATKSGGFGGARALVDVVEFLREGRR